MMTYQEYLAAFEADRAFNAIFGPDEPLIEAEWTANEAVRTKRNAEAEADRLQRLAVAGHGPEDIVRFDDRLYVLRDVRPEYDGQPSRFWVCKLYAKDHTGADIDNVDYARITIELRT